MGSETLASKCYKLSDELKLINFLKTQPKTSPNVVKTIYQICWRKCMILSTLKKTVFLNIKKMCVYKKEILK